jgi:hypothetical protein
MASDVKRNVRVNSGPSVGNLRLNVVHQDSVKLDSPDMRLLPNRPSRSGVGKLEVTKAAGDEAGA